MNKTDQMREANYWDSLGVDPDTVMVSQTIEEYAESHGEEVDYFDEDKMDIKNIQNDIQDCTYEIPMIEQEIIDIQAQINEIVEEVDRLEKEKRNAAARNWAEAVDLEDSIKEENAKTIPLIERRDALKRKLELLIKKREVLAKEFQEKQASFDTKYGR